MQRKPEGRAPADELPSSPAAQRNKAPILEVLSRTLPAGEVLEIASGAAEHAAYFAAALPEVSFQPTDADSRLLDVARRRCRTAALANLKLPLELDVTGERWPNVRPDAMLCINLLHVAPWRATEGLLRGAAALLPDGAPLVIYGPFFRAGVPPAPSNLAFDESLKARDPQWGVRALEDVIALAAEAGLELDEIVEMPANNLTVVLRRRLSRDRASTG